MVVFCLLFVSVGLESQENLDAKQIVDKSFQATRLAGSEMLSTMTIIDSRGRERVRKIATVSKLYDSGEQKRG